MSQSVPENLKARLKESYDAIADTYALHFTKEDDPIRLRYISHLFEHFNTGGQDIANVLELGCGSGIPATKFMLQHDETTFQVTGNDISSTQLSHARSNLAEFSDRVTLVEGDMLSLDFANSTFDAVTGFYSIIHLPRDEQTQLMRKISDWLKPGGFFLANFSVEEMAGHERERWLEHEKGWMFWSGWGVDGTLKMVENVGMEILLKEVHEDIVDATFVWILARKSS